MIILYSVTLILSFVMGIAAFVTLFTGFLARKICGQSGWTSKNTAITFYYLLSITVVCVLINYIAVLC